MKLWVVFLTTYARRLKKITTKGEKTNDFRQFA